MVCIKFKIERETKALFNPENPRNRTALDENYQIGLPLIEKKAAYKMQTHLITGSTIDHLATLPLVYRKNPTVNKTRNSIRAKAHFNYTFFNFIFSWFHLQYRKVKPSMASTA